MLFEGRYPLCRDSTGGASGLASAAIDTSGFVDLALVAILRNGFDRTRRHASAATDADSFINLMGHFELLLCMDEKRNASPGSSPSSYARSIAASAIKLKSHLHALTKQRKCRFAGVCRSPSFPDKANVTCANIAYD